jgi:hypothetical protein
MPEYTEVEGIPQSTWYAIRAPRFICVSLREARSSAICAYGQRANHSLLDTCRIRETPALAFDGSISVSEPSDWPVAELAMRFLNSKDNTRLEACNPFSGVSFQPPIAGVQFQSSEGIGNDL